MLKQTTQLVLALILAGNMAAAGTLVGWDFDQGAAGWRDEAGSAPETTGDGTLWPGSAEGVSLRAPAFNVTTQAFQTIELLLSVRGGGPIHLVWQGESRTGTATGWQGALPVQVPADGQLHALRLLPLWQNLRLITGLRMIGPPGLQLRLRSLRLTGPNTDPAEQTGWQFGNPTQAGQWLPLLGVAVLRPQPDGTLLRLMDREVIVASPPLVVPTYRYEWLSLDLTVRNPVQTQVQWATTVQRGLHGPALDLRPGRHTYSVHCGEEESWNGELSGLALTLQGKPPAELILHDLRLSNAPQGPADLRTTFVGPMEPVVDVDQAFRFVWVLRNDGGETARAIRVSVTADDTVSIPTSTIAIDRLPHGVPEPVTWLAKASGPGTVRLRADYGERFVEAEVRLTPGPAMEPMAGGRVPAPAARGQYPMFVHLHETPPPGLGPVVLDRMLYHRPYLGDYDLQPEVVDWQVKWALEHGVTGFIVDVRRDKAQALDAFLGSRLARQVSLCLRWTDPVPTVEAARALLAEMAPIMAQPNYLHWQDQPVLLVGRALQRGREGWGLSDLQALAAEKRTALIACMPLNMAGPDLLQKAGYAAAADMHTEDLVAACQPVVEAWEDATQRHVPHVMCLQPAWQTELTPERLAMLTRIALLRSQRRGSLALPLVIVGDWNGEHGLEPRRPEGAQWLEALSVATGVGGGAPLLPVQVGLGPYDRALPAAPRNWEFETKETWTSAMGMSVLRILDGQLTGRTDSDQPAMFGGDTMLDTRAFPTAVIGLAASAGKQGRLWWRTSLRKLTVEHSLSFDIIADGAVHEYRLDLSRAPGWEGYLRGLRLDPTDVAGAAVALDYVRIVP
ncbi:MAG: hypothetical protein KKI08_19075 [Armatimonadetes bacterium]|nr:hypothetical protein [Armatimonadota bacterium]